MTDPNSSTLPAKFPRPLCAALALALFFAVLLVYSGMADHEFLKIWDDQHYVTNNPAVLAGITRESVAVVFWRNVSGNWQPLTQLSHMLDVELFGLDAGAHHRTSAWLHAFNTVLVFYLMLAFSRCHASRVGAVPESVYQVLGKSALVAAIFGLHPLHVESVAWIAERKDVLSGLFFLLCLLAYIRWVQQPGWRRYGWVALTLTLGLMAKSMLVTTPLILLLVDVWPLRRFAVPVPSIRAAVSQARPLIVEKLPLFLLAFIAGILTLVYQADSSAIMSTDYMGAPARVANAVMAYGAYLGKFLVPIDLAAYYPVAQRSHTLLSVLLWVGPGLLTLGIFLRLGVVAHARAPYLLFGFALFLIMLLPVLGLIKVGSQSMADRYMYLPILGPCMIVGWGLADLAAHWAPLRSRTTTALSFVSVVIALGGMGFMTAKQVQVWSNGETLWQHARAVVPGNHRAMLHLGVLRFMAGQYEEALGYLQEYKALGGQPEARLLGLIYVRLGRMNDAKPLLEEAVQRSPRDAHLHFALAEVGYARKEWREAESHCQRAIELNPFEPGYRVLLRWIQKR